MLYRHGRSSLGSAARLPQQPGFLLLVYSSTPKVLKRLPASRPNPQAGIWEVDVGTSSEILTTRGADNPDLLWAPAPRLQPVQNQAGFFFPL
ncbi:LOW QUALITY PROTEIN: hypothetical protein U0070_023625 [Myodes glareolus]|uniref:Uncharacterized protein n=1 Tax=Myodes glareolus TaxID=447135 RepID=A0AAW0IP02_MYOGA